jgi:hypothetical protein
MNSKKEKNHYLRLVRSDLRITSEDLKLLFEKDLEHTSSYWIFAVSALVGILAYALGSFIALGPNSLSTYVGRVTTVVLLTVFVGITLFLYVENWERVSRKDFRYYIEARAEIEARTQMAQTPTQSQSEGQTTSTPQSSNVSDTPRGTKRDIETDKLRLAWDYGKSVQLSLLVITFSAFAGIMTILTSLLVTKSVNPLSEAGAAAGSFFVIVYGVVGIRVRLRKLVINTDRAFIDLEQGKTLESFKSLCEVESASGSAREEFVSIFPWGKVGIILVALLVIFMIAYGFVLFHY